MSGEVERSSELDMSGSKGNTDSDRSTDQQRCPSPVPSCMSLKSDQSNDKFINFHHQDKAPGILSTDQQRCPSPVPSCMSLKSDQSNDKFINFHHQDKAPRILDKRRIHELDASDQDQQQDLKHIFLVLEEKIVTFVKIELKRFKWVLSPDYQESFESKDEEESEDAREGVLKMALHFLRNMEQTSIADKLQAHELDVVCQTKLKKTLKRKYQNVSEGIAQQGSSALLEKIYTEIYITEGGSGKVNEEHEVRQIESRSKRSAGQETPIQCNDIFTPLPGQDKPIRSVMTKGVAGIGKSISVQKYILNWAEGKENQEIRFIFPLPFRELNLIRQERYSLMGLLHHFFPDIMELTFDTQDKYKMLFVFDGLDECRLQLNFQKNESLTDISEVTSLDVLLTNLIKGNLLPFALLWITSRPAAAHQIPPECVERVTEAQGFSDPQKEKYFLKRISDEKLAGRILSHIKSSRSLHIMCHIPVFCWITATVLEVILGSSGGEQIPKTLTEMYTYFLIFQTKQRSLKFEHVHDLDPQWNQEIIFDLGKLAYEQLEKGNLIFYEEDLRESGIDVREAAVYSGICTQIFKEESGIYQGKVFCFMHLSIQEYLAALYVFLMMAVKKKDTMSQQQNHFQLFNWLWSWFSSAEESTVIFHKNAVDKALEHEDGRFDLFLRFLLGLSLESNQSLLHGLIPNRQNQMCNEVTICYIKDKIRDMPSSERVINLFHCLNELNDHSLVEEVQSFLSAGALSEATLSPAQWSALVFVLLTSEDKLDVFDLKKYLRSDEGLQRLQQVVEESQTALLNGCNLTERSCTVLACIICKASSNLKHLDLSNNSIGDTGAQELCTGLEDPNCALETLKLSDCNITGEGYAALASALKSNPSHLLELDLRGNDPGDSAVELLTEFCTLLNDQEFKLQTLRLLKSDAAVKANTYLESVLGTNPLLLTEFDLSQKNLGDSGVQQLCAILEDSHCKLNKLKLSHCGITGDGYAALASALKSNSSHLVELDLRGNDPGDSAVDLLTDLCNLLSNDKCKLKTLRLLKSDAAVKANTYLESVLGTNPLLLTEFDLSQKKLGDSGVQQFCSLLEDSHCRLKRLKLIDSSITGEGCAALTSSLTSNPSHLRELNLNGNQLGDSGVKHISALLEKPDCKWKKLELSHCGITGGGYAALASALKSNPSHLVELDLRGNDPGDSAVELLTGLYNLLSNDKCKLQTLRLLKSDAAVKANTYLESVLGTNPLLLTEFDLSQKKLGDSGVQQFCSLLEDSHCKLKKLKLERTNINEEGCAALASALKSNPSHLIELNLSRNNLGDSGVKHISAVLMNPHCRLEKLQLERTHIKEEGCAALASALTSNPTHLIELNLSWNKLGDSGVKHISDLLMNPDCRLEKLLLDYTYINKEDCAALASALKSNPSHLMELNLSRNEVGDSGVKHISAVLMNPDCRLEKLLLVYTNINEEGCAALASALKSNPSHLIELNLSGNEVGDSGVKHISAVLMNPDCRLEKLLLEGTYINEEGCAALASALKSNPSHLIELNLSWNEVGDSGVKHISAVLMNPDCRLEKLLLDYTNIHKEGCAALASALKSNPSHLIELNLSGNKLRDSGVKHISAVLMNPDCRLEKLLLCNTGIYEEGWAALASALESNPASRLIELVLSRNTLGDSVKQRLCALVEDPNYKLQKLELDQWPK